MVHNVSTADIASIYGRVPYDTCIGTCAVKKVGTIPEDARGKASCAATF